MKSAFDVNAISSLKDIFDCCEMFVESNDEIKYILSIHVYYIDYPVTIAAIFSCYVVIDTFYYLNIHIHNSLILVA